MTRKQLNHLLDRPACDPRLWLLDPGVVFLNHGSFGSCPRPVLDFQRRIRDRLERQPVQFFVRDLERLLDEARGALAEFLGADAAELVFVPNATSGVNSVLRSLRFKRGDELLVTNHEYNACRNALDFVAGRSRARGVVAGGSFSLGGPKKGIASLMRPVCRRKPLAPGEHVA